MKSIKNILFIASLATGLWTQAADAPAGVPDTNVAGATQPTLPSAAPTEAPTVVINLVTNVVTNIVTIVVTNADANAAPNTAANSPASAGTSVAVRAATNEPPVVVENGTNGLLMTFTRAPLNLVLERMADAAGFIINMPSEVRGYVTIWSKGPVTKDEAVDLLYSVLKKNGYALTRKDRVLTISQMDSIKTADLEITTPYNPDDIASGDEVITSIIHIRYANATQLMANLELLLPQSATLTANESANTLILVATKTDVKRMLKIINALDSSIASVSSIKVMPLKYADAKETANLITQLFTSQTAGQTGANGGRGNLLAMFAGGGGRNNSGGRNSSGSGAGGAAAAHVVAVSDDRSNSLVVSAPEDLLTTISEMVDKIDQEVTDVTELRVFRLVNADPNETADQLMQLFPDPASQTGGGQNNPAMFFGGGRLGRTAAAGAANSSDRTKKMGKVTAVPEPRTGSLIVTASKSLMPQIEDLIAALDSNKGKRETVGYYELQYADPQDIYANLQDLFNRSQVRMQNNNSKGLMGNNNPLTQRETLNQNNTSGTTSFGTGGSRGGGAPGGMNLGN